MLILLTIDAWGNCSLEQRLIIIVITAYTFIIIPQFKQYKVIYTEKNAPNTEPIGILYPVRCKFLTFQIVMHIGIIISMPGD